MSLNVRIPKPCHEDWNAMLPEVQGRHCLACCKTVVDFTGWEAPAIKAYLEANTGKSVCGRFHASQLEAEDIVQEITPDFLVQQIHYAHLSVFKKIAAIIIVVFGLTAASCNDNVQGKIAPPAVVETTPTMGAMLGEPVADTTQKQTIQKKTQCKPVTTVAPEEPRMLQGEVAMPAEPEELKGKVLMGDTIIVGTDSLP